MQDRIGCAPSIKRALPRLQPGICLLLHIVIRVVVQRLYSIEERLPGGHQRLRINLSQRERPSTTSKALGAPILLIF